MDFLEHTTIILSIFFTIMSIFMFMFIHLNKRAIIPTNWHVLGMIPGMLVNSHRKLDYVTEILMHTGGTFMWKGPWFSKMNILFTADPLDFQHVLCKNFTNYPKGDEFRKIFEVLGDGIFSSDGKLWEIHRKVTMSLLKHPKYPSLLEEITWNKVEKGLLPILESICGEGIEVDLQEIFERFAFDTMCKIILDHDSKSLSIDFPDVACVNAFSNAGEAVFQRHFAPRSFWKLQQLFRVGNEKKLSDAWKTFDDFLFTCLAQKQNEYNTMNCEQQEKGFLLLPTIQREIKDKYEGFGDPTKILRDFLLSLMAADKDSLGSVLSWFFYMLAKNPNVEDKICEELYTHMGANAGERWNTKELGEMIYLHAALSETLRLFPPLSLNYKSTSQPDILPSGHKVDHNTKIVISYYSMGRMKSVWGEDCMEFKPERWIAKGGGIKHEPSYKFSAFNAGPRTCLGKEICFCQLKIVIATIIYRYHIELVEGHPAVPKDSVTLVMKDGLKVRVTKRTI